MKWILSIAALFGAIGTIYAFADDVLYFQSEANIHLTQDSRRICHEDGALLIVLEAQYPPGSNIPPHVAQRMAELRESVARHCTRRAYQANVHHSILPA